LLLALFVVQRASYLFYQYMEKKMKNFFIILCATGFTFSISNQADARAFRLSQIPNNQWGCAACHSSPSGGGRNSFGRDVEQYASYAGAQFENWSDVCLLDSDGDGATNGQELGDPNCMWSTGNPNPMSAEITNPADANSVPTEVPMGGEMMGGEMMGGEMMGGEMMGGEVAGGEVAGGDIAGGDVAGGDVAGGDVAGGEIAGGSSEMDMEPTAVSDDGCQSAPTSSSLGLLLIFVGLLTQLRRRMFA
jgi:MYXO-CTERM domain-containing protein